MELRILACRTLLLPPAFQRHLALELLAGDLAAEQPGEGADGCIGARRIVAARFRTSMLILSRLNAIVSRNPMPGRGRDHRRTADA
jgi:hypothetical protein